MKKIKIQKKKLREKMVSFRLKKETYEALYSFAKVNKLSITEILEHLIEKAMSNKK